MNYLRLGFLLAFFAVLFGAFGAHALPSILPDADVDVFRVGVRYHMWHALGIMVMGLLNLVKSVDFKWSVRFFCVGIIVFSGGLYLYEVTQVPFFVKLVPLGGMAYMVGWLLAFKGLIGFRGS